MNRVRRRTGRFQRIFADGQKTFVGDGERLRPGKAHDGQTAFAERRGDCGNGVVVHQSRVEGRESRVKAVFAFVCPLSTWERWRLAGIFLDETFSSSTCRRDGGAPRKAN
jgi:hypothetical protein